MKISSKIRDTIVLIFRKIRNLIIYICKKVWQIRKAFYIIPIALLISISQNISSRSQLEFSFSGKSGGQVMENGKLYYQFRHGGLIKNKSKEKNTITSINLVVWADDKEESTLRDGYGPSWMIDNRTGEKIKLPLIVEGREAIDVDIFNQLFVQGTEDEKLLPARQPTVQGSPFTIPKYDFQLTFTDINSNEFDERGKLINRDVVDMNWTISNYCGDVHYKILPCLIQKAKIVDSKIMFRIKNIFHWFGMESIGDSLYKIGTNFEK
ncbi:MAG: hypothetical protein HW401_544 [Parcubacteria group bacterium]|nr:hypothetical protein [Parcubacteria group bacterium]